MMFSYGGIKVLKVYSCNVEKFEQETFGTMLNGMDFVSTITCGG
jgi:hypothetical protein